MEVVLRDLSRVLGGEHIGLLMQYEELQLKSY